MTALRGHAARTSQRPKPHLGMHVWGDTMHGVHIVVGWRRNGGLMIDTVKAYDVHDMLHELKRCIRRHLR